MGIKIVIEIESLSYESLVTASSEIMNMADSLNSNTTEQKPILQTTQVNITNVDLDSEGLPWDARIHASSKLKLKKTETWKLKKGIDPTLVEQVKSELRTAMNAAPAAPAVPTPEPAAPAAPAVPTPEPAAPVAPEPAAPVAPEPAAPVAPEPAAPETVVMFVLNGEEWTEEQLKDSGWNDEQLATLTTIEKVVEKTITISTFPEFMGKLTQAMVDGEVTQERVDTIMKKHGLASTPLLAARPDLIPVIAGELF